MLIILSTAAIDDCWKTYCEEASCLIRHEVVKGLARKLTLTPGGLLPSRPIALDSTTTYVIKARGHGVTLADAHPPSNATALV